MLNVNIFIWVVKISALVIILFGLPFYFGYGNPLPFINANYTLWDNLWLTIFPLMFFGLALGWKNEKLGGYMVSVPIIFGLLFGYFLNRAIVTHMFVPLVVGIMYLIIGYRNNKRKISPR